MNFTFPNCTIADFRRGLTTGAVCIALLLLTQVLLDTTLWYSIPEIEIKFQIGQFAQALLRVFVIAMGIYFVNLWLDTMELFRTIFYLNQKIRTNFQQIVKLFSIF